MSNLNQSRHIPAHSNHERPARSIPFNETKGRERIFANLSLIASMCSDQALHVDIVSGSPNAGDDLRAISMQLDQIADRLEQAGGVA